MRMGHGLRDRALVSVVIPVWNSAKWLPGCLSSLAKQEFKDFSVILVDNGSEDGSLQEVDVYGLPDVTIVSFSENRGFAAAVNAGIRASSSPFIALLNVDVIVDPDWLQALVSVMEQCPQEVGALASAMLSMDNPILIDAAGDVFSWYGSATKRGHGRPLSEYGQQEEVASVCAGAALYRRNFFNKVGLFDEKFTSYLEDVDLCLRGRIFGFRYIYVPSAKVLHKGHGSGVAGDYYVFLLTRNRLLVFLKNIPLRLLCIHSARILYGQLYFFIVYRRFLATLKGYCSFLMLFPHVLRERKRILANRQQVQNLSGSLLKKEFGEPSLCELIFRKLAR